MFEALSGQFMFGVSVMSKTTNEHEDIGYSQKGKKLQRHEKSFCEFIVVKVFWLK